METLLIQSEHLSETMLARCNSELHFIFVHDRKSLCEKIVDVANVAGIGLEMEQIDEENKEFLISLRRHFPLLKIGVISPVEIEGENVSWINPEAGRESADGASQGQKEQDLCSFVRGPFEQNKRGSHRFDWILTGYLGSSNGERNRYRLRSLSAGGAFLESEGPAPVPGSLTTLRINFQNFQLFTECEVLERRMSSSNSPPGFGVRFVHLQDKTRELINRMINDAVFQVLIEPRYEPEIPSLFEEELTADLMAL